MTGWSDGSLGIGLSDSLTVSDSLVLSLLLAQGDSVPMEDAVGKEIAQLLEDTQPLSDSASTTTDFARLISDTVALLDGRTTIADYARQYDETITLVDAVGKSFAPATFSDGVTSSDDFGPASETLRKADELVAVDELLVASTFYRDIAQSIGLSSAATYGLETLLSDSQAISDALGAVLLKDLTGLLGEEVTLTDASLFSFTTNPADLVSLADSRRLDLAREIQDQLDLTDQTVKVWQAYLEMVDSVTSTDDLTIDIDLADNYTVDLDDTISMSDSLTWALQTLLSDGVTVTDTPLSEIFYILGYEQSAYRARTYQSLPPFNLYAPAPFVRPVESAHELALYAQQFMATTIQEAPTAEVFAT